MSNPLESAKAELQALLAQKSLIDKKITAIEQTIKILEPTYGSPPLWPTLMMNLMLSANDLGLTFAIRKVFETHPNTELSPISVRDHAAVAGFTFEGRSNPMAEVHQILKRLVESDRRYIAVPKSDGTCYKFDPSIHPTYRRRKPAQPQPPAMQRSQPPEKMK